jgi:hypothetical protein
MLKKIKFQEKESGLAFEFLVKTYKFDSANSLYEKNKFCGNSGVDFLILDLKNLYFLEVKDGRYFDVENEKLDEKICHVYSKFIDSVSLIALSDDNEIKPYRVRLKNKSPKLLLFIAKNLPPDRKIILYERINKNLRKKLKRLNRNIDFHIEMLSLYNKKLYRVYEAK